MNIGIGLGLTNYMRVPTVALDPDAAIAALFESGEEGAWYDPSDSTTVFQDAAGTTPATVGDPVGLILDKSQGLTLGSELVTNGTFDTDTDWVKATGTSITGGEAVFSASTNQSALFQVISGLTTSVGAAYSVTFTITAAFAGSIGVRLASAGTTQVVFYSLPGTYTVILYVGSISPINKALAFHTAGAFTGSIDNISIRELPGNHATQTTSAARPVLQQSGATPVLSGSELGSVSTTSVTHSEVDGLRTITNVYEGGSVVSGRTYKIDYSVDCTVAPAQPVELEYRIGTGTLVLVTYMPAQQQYSGSLVFTADASDSFIVRIDEVTTTRGGSFDNISISVQEVTSWSGGLRYLDFDGVDDSMKTAAFATISQPISNAIACTATFADVALDGEVSNQHSYYFWDYGSGDIVRFATLGHNNADSVAPCAHGLDHVLLGCADGTSSFVRVDGTQTSTPSTGSGGISAITLGSSASGGNHLNGNIYGVVLIDRTLTAGEITDLETYLAAKSGVTL